jgi:hypothetical protein
MSEKKTPILLILFNRIEITKELLLSLQKIKPENLYIYFDGPRENCIKDDTNAFLQIEELIDKYVDWTCQLNIKHSKKNRGSHVAPKRAIDWFFTCEENGIILEDDCIPDPSFYDYCKFLLEEYKYDDEVFLISGDNAGPLIPAKLFNENDYLFSKVPLTWGWATWKNRWEKVDENLEIWKDSFLKNRYLLNPYPLYESLLIYNMLRRISYREEKNWDYLVYSTMIKNNKFSIMPKYNLIKNIGWGSDATHTQITNFRSYFPSKDLSNFNYSGDITNSVKIDMIISYMVHFGIFLDEKELKNFFLIRIKHIFNRTKYFTVSLVSKLKKLLT